MLKKINKPLLGLLLMVFFLYLVLSRAPAQLLAWGVQQAAPNVFIMNPVGTIWQGSSATAQVNIPPKPLALGSLRWKIKPLSFLTLAPCIEFSTYTPTMQSGGNVCYSLGGTVKITGLTADAPAGLLQDYAKLFVSGQMSLSIQEAAFSTKKISQLKGQASVQNARANLGSGWVPLGAFATNLSPADAEGVAVKAEIFDISGPIKVDVTATLNPLDFSQTRAEGMVKFEAGAPSQAREGIQLIGEEVSQNTFKVAW